MMFPLFRGGHFRWFRWVEADGDYIEILAEIERSAPSSSPPTLVGARYRAWDTGNNRGSEMNRTSVAKIVGEFSRGCPFVAEFEIDRNLGVEMLVNADELQSWRPLIHRRSHDPPVP